MSLSLIIFTSILVLLLHGPWYSHTSTTTTSSGTSGGTTTTTRRASGPILLAHAAPLTTKPAAWIKKCEADLPKAFTSEQRSAFCKGLTADTAAPSVACANEARSQLKYKYEEVVDLCRGATGIYPVTCLSSLTMKERSDVGAKLCPSAESDFTAQCWKGMSGIVNKASKKTAGIVDEAIAFCQAAASPLAVDCVKASLSEYTSVDASLAMHRCNLVMSGSTSSDEEDNAYSSSSSSSTSSSTSSNSKVGYDNMVSCLRTLKSSIAPNAKRGGGSSSSSSSSSSSVVKDPQKSMVFVEDAIEFCALSLTHPAALDCYKSSCDLSISVTDRLRLCYGSDSTTGPVECLSHLLSSYSSLSFSSDHTTTTTTTSTSSSSGTITTPPVAAERTAIGIQLCSAAHSSAPSMCFAEGIRQKSMLGAFEDDSIFATTSPRRKQRGSSSSSSSSLSSESNLVDSLLAAYDFTSMDGTLLTLCQGADVTSGPIDCYRESQSAFRPGDLKSEITMEWYNSRSSSSSSSSSSSTGSIDVNAISREVRVQLCLHASSEAPAHCASKAPHWLAVSERLDLCSVATDGQEPLRCMQTIEGPSKRFHQAPSKMLGYFLDSIYDNDAKYIRSQLVQMCSYSGSTQPTSAAQCFATAPQSLKLMDAIYLCMNHTIESTSCAGTTCSGNETSSNEGDAKIASTNMALYLSSCIRLAPKEWPSEDQALVCKGVRSTAEAEGAVKCVRTVISGLSGTSISEASEICNAWRFENVSVATIEQQGSSSSSSTSSGSSSGSSSSSKTSKSSTSSTSTSTSGNTDRGAAFFDSTVRCIKAAISSLQANGRPLGPISKTILSTCAGAVSEAPGTCLAQLASQWRYTYEDGAIEAFCKSINASSRLGCIGKIPEAKRGGGLVVTKRDALRCLEVAVVPTSAKIVSIWSSNPEHGPEIQSGTRFSVSVRLLDQWDQPFVTSSEPITVYVSINTNNAQGAVLWGTRSNVTSINDATGIVRFDNLMISQAGEVKLKIAVRKSSAGAMEQANNLRGSSGRYSDRSQDDYSVLISGILNVRVNPQLQDTIHCGFVFRQGICPNGLSFASDWASEFPRESAYFSNSRYLSMLACHSLIVDSWGIEMEISPTYGSSLLSYRDGVDAMWTGGPGFPTEDMSYLARLELNRTEWISDLDLLESAISALQREEEQKAMLEKESQAAPLTSTEKAKSSAGATKKQCKRLSGVMQKVLRKAYYRKSLQWHPDRWMAYPIYADAVSRAFELISEAYESLSKELAALIPTAAASSSSTASTEPS